MSVSYLHPLNTCHIPHRQRGVGAGCDYLDHVKKNLYTTGPWNAWIWLAWIWLAWIWLAWIWLANEHSKVCNYFQGTLGERSDRITCNYHFAEWFQLFQRYFAYNSRITKIHNDTGQTNKCGNKRIKTTDNIHVFAPELGFIMYGKHILHHSR